MSSLAAGWRSRWEELKSLWMSRDLLWRGARLARATRLEFDRPNEKSFVRASVLQARSLAITIGAATLLTAVGMTVLWRQAAAERDLATEHVARVAAVQGLTLRGEGLDRALLIGLASHERIPTFESRTSLLSLLSEGALLERVIRRDPNLVHVVELDPSGRSVAFFGGRRWELCEGGGP